MKMKLIRQYCFLVSILLCCWVSYPCSALSSDAPPGSDSQKPISLKPIRVLATASPSATVTGGASAFVNAQNALNRSDYPGALAFSQQAVAEDPSNLNYQYLLGIAYFKMSKLDEAEAIFLALTRADSVSFQKAFFDLSALYLQKNETENAMEMLQKAYSLDPGRSEMEMGDICLKQKQFDKAARHFKQAAIKKPELKADAEMLQALTLFQSNNASEAKQMLQNVLAMNLPPEKMTAARQLLDSINETQKADKPWYLSATIGVQQDNNVFQNPLENVGVNPYTGGVRNAEDTSSIFSLTGKYRLLRKDSWSLWGVYNHYQTNYIHNTDLNLVGSRPSLQFVWDRSPLHAGLEYAYAHYWVNGKSTVGVHSILPRFLMDHPDNWQSSVFGAMEWKIYQNQTPYDTHYQLILCEKKMFPNIKSHIRAQYETDLDVIGADGRGNITTHEVLLGIQYPLWFDGWFMDISGRYNWKFFQHDLMISTTTDRTDEQKSLMFAVFGHLYGGLYLNLMVQPIWNTSNIINQYNYDPYAFNKALTACYLTYTF